MASLTTFIRRRKCVPNYYIIHLFACTGFTGYDWKLTRQLSAFSHSLAAYVYGDTCLLCNWLVMLWQLTCHRCLRLVPELHAQVLRWQHAQGLRLQYAEQAAGGTVCLPRQVQTRSYESMGMLY